jgi:hypothetical protein
MRTAAAFDQFHREPPSMRVLKWIVGPVVAVHIVLATISGYRAIVQVYRVDLAASDSILRPGTTVSFAAASSGRVPVDVEVELIQGSRRDTLAVKWIPDHPVASYDPRTINAAGTVTVTADHLAHFNAGPAILRVTGNGKSQWLRVPPPRVRELPVRIGE